MVGAGLAVCVLTLLIAPPLAAQTRATLVTSNSVLNGTPNTVRLRMMF